MELQELGAGAQGRVVLARHEVSGQHVAIKYLASGLLGDSHARATFRSEAELLRRVADPHVTRLLDYVEAPRGAAIVMEVVAGPSLRAVLDRRDRPLEPEAALTVLKGSLRGLAAAHAVGVVHRDYKPANVLVQSDGQSKLIDFGVAVLSGQGGIMGTPAYMAPEQWQGAPATPATDVYAATCVFFECVTGRKPYGAATQGELRAQHMAAPIPIDGVPEALRSLIVQGMAKHPGQRRGNVAAFLDELEAAAVANYGAGWERRGLIALGTAAAVLAAALPFALISSALSPGAVIGSAGEAAHALGGNGLLAKIGGAKAAGGAVAGTAAAVMIATYFLPAGADVGGTSTGDYRAYFGSPRVVLDNTSIPDGDTDASPLISEKITVSPARARAGTRVRVDTTWHGRTPWGLQYLGPGRFRCHGPDSERGDAYHSSYSVALGEQKNESKDSKKPKFWLYRTSEKSPNDIPSGTPVPVQGALLRQNDQEKYYDHKHCSWTFNGTTAAEVIIPAEAALKPGKYRLSRHNPVGIGFVRAEVGERLTTISPASADARVEGSLPTLEVLE
ncbi:serine/threonine-protein kinase [Actinomadura rugatobispora]|uniref:non-specific serine/threonine protein kinase n=1 Tax=Actinomadura rugatobispora TaxID=1994 RepID=A0ABW1A4M5_9ACTN